MNIIKKRIFSSVAAFCVGVLFSASVSYGNEEKHFTPEQIIAVFKDNDPKKHEKLEIENKKLKVTAIGEGFGWYSDSKGPLLYETVEGDFLIETEVIIKRKDGKAGLPEANFSSAGLLIRDPGSSHGKEKWVMYNIGVQNKFYGLEAKATRPLGKHKDANTEYNYGLHSLSTLYLIPNKNTGAMKLRAARVGDELRFYFKENGRWIEAKVSEGFEMQGNGSTIPVSQFSKDLLRPNKLGFPGKLQVGLVVNPGMDASKPFIEKRDGYALFSYFSMRKIAGFEDAVK